MFEKFPSPNTRSTASLFLVTTLYVFLSDFDKELYNKYLSHQPYEDCKSLEIDKVVETKIGSLIYWDRVRIHSSDNFMKNNVKSKTLLAFFTSKNRID